MRYFLICYRSDLGHIGNVWFSANGFPSKAQIKELCCVDENNSCVITSVYEFKDETDFNNFCGENSK